MSKPFSFRFWIWCSEFWTEFEFVRKCEIDRFKCRKRCGSVRNIFVPFSSLDGTYQWGSIQNFKYGDWIDGNCHLLFYRGLWNITTKFNAAARRRRAWQYITTLAHDETVVGAHLNIGVAIAYSNSNFGVVSSNFDPKSSWSKPNSAIHAHLPFKFQIQNFD